jgi:hypothetical protein
MVVLQPYCNRDGTVRYAADIRSVRRRQKCCKTADLPNMPVRNITGDAELTRRRSLVRTQHRPLWISRRNAESVGRNWAMERVFVRGVRAREKPRSCRGPMMTVTIVIV